MHAYLEDSVTRSDCALHTLSWMGKVPETVPDEEEWKLNRTSYYQEGWLATGNSRGIVGVTFSTCHCKKNFDAPPRTNFNLRGHRSEVVLVKWNEPYQKLATCDATGVIFVWIKHEGRWSIELINDRNSQVTDFAWSHDGRMALICYRDGFVLVGSVAGQRYWSSMLNLDGCMITCGCWTPDDQKVLFGTTDGQVIVMSSTGAMLSQLMAAGGQEVATLAWNCEKFYLGEQYAGAGGGGGAGGDTASTTSSESFHKPHCLAVSLRSGAIYFMANYDDVCPKVINTGLTGLKLEWSNDGEILAVAGFVRLPNLECRNELRFYNRSGQLRHRLPLVQQNKPITAMTWGHNDRRLYVAVGCYVYTLWVTKKVASLQSCCRRVVMKSLSEEGKVAQLPLPTKLRNSVSALFSATIKGYIPAPTKLREFVCVPPPASERLHCTMIKHGEENSGGHYTLYLEYLGGLIPLLKGKRASKLRPEFVVYDPKIRTAWKSDKDECSLLSSESSPTDSDTDSEQVDGCGSPRVHRKRRLKKRRERQRIQQKKDMDGQERNVEDMMYDESVLDVGNKSQKLLEVTSNIWGTKFKIHGLATFLPDDLGTVLYKTSLLHLQPRQMTINILELCPSLRPLARDPNYSPHTFSESEDETPVSSATDCGTSSLSSQLLPPADHNVPAISPELPPHHPHRLHPTPTHHVTTAETTHRPACLTTNSLEVPVEKYPTAKSDKLTPLEIKTLDGSPPQRRSPSLKSRSLSPAEATQLAYSNMLMDLGDFENKDNNKGAVPKVCMNNHRNKKGDGVNNGPRGENVVTPTSALNIMHMAAKKLETVMSMNGVTSVEARSEPPGGSSVVLLPSTQATDVQRWAGKACQEIRYIDDDVEEVYESRADTSKDTVYASSGVELTAVDIMRSTQILSDMDSSNSQTSVISNSTISNGSQSQMSQWTSSTLSCSSSQCSQRQLIDPKPRVILSKPPPHQTKSKRHKSQSTNCYSIKGSLRTLASNSTDRNDYYGSSMEDIDSSTVSSTSTTPRSSRPSSPMCFSGQEMSIKQKRSASINHTRRASLDIKRDVRCSNVYEEAGCASLPTSPVHKASKPAPPPQKRAKSKQELSGSVSKLLLSPLSRRRWKNLYKSVESSDDEGLMSGDEVTTSENYKDLETFQKAQLTKKLRKVQRTHSDMSSTSPVPSSPSKSPQVGRKLKQFVLHNKAPLWNENSQVYQLDFGGRVTQESAKNFQIEFRGKQVMQFGRIDTNAYTLDFQYPFSAIQAFAVALANVTQRLK